MIGVLIHSGRITSYWFSVSFCFFPLTCPELCGSCLCYQNEKEKAQMKKITLLAASALLLLTACGQVENNSAEIAPPPITAVQEDIQQPQVTPEPATTVQEQNTVSGAVQEQPQKEKASQTKTVSQAAQAPEPVEELTEDIPSETVHAKTGYVEPEPTPEPEPSPTPSTPADQQAAIPCLTRTRRSSTVRRRSRCW